MDGAALTESIMQQAAAHVRIARDVFGLTCDYSEASMAALDDAISKFHPQGNKLQTTIISYGAYIGETVRRNLGGTWAETDDDTMLKDVGGVGITIYPFTWARKRLANGMEDSIAYKYAYVKSEVLKEGGKAASFPALALPSGREEQEAAAKAAEAPHREILSKAPLIVFLLVAMADGEVDDREIAAFHSLAEDALTIRPPLLQRSIADSMLNAEKLIDEDTTTASLIAELQRVREVLDDAYATEADEFKRGLMGIARKTATASGGFLGINKVSKEESAMIELIAATLGVN